MSKKRPDLEEIEDYNDGLDDSDSETITLRYSKKGKGSPAHSPQRGTTTSKKRGETLRKSRIGQFMDQSENLAKELHKREKTLAEENTSNNEDESLFFKTQIKRENKDDNPDDLRKYENTEQLGMYMREHHDITWNQLTVSDKFKLINMFSPLAIAGNLFQLLGTAIYYIQDDGEISLAEILIGMGCLFAWCTLPRYFMYSQRYSLVLRTIKFAVPVLTRAIIGILPFFIAFAILGQCLFWEMEYRFGSFSYAFFALFSMMNGDNLVPIHTEIMNTNRRFLLGNLYVYAYVILSIV